MSSNANKSRVDPVASSSRLKDTLRVADTGAVGSIRVSNIEIARVVSNRSVAEFKTRYEDTSDARRFCAVFLHFATAFKSNCQNVHGDTNIGAWPQPWKLFCRDGSLER